MATPDIPDTRSRLVAAAEKLFRTQSYSGVGLKLLTTTARAPWGSLYHFFPAGKAALAVEAAEHAGEIYAEGWRRAFASTADPATAVASVFEAEIRVLQASDYRNGCPIASLTLDMASQDERLRGACHAAFARWTEAITAGFEAYGAPTARARELALFTLAAIEGAIVLARASHSPASLEAAGRHTAARIRREAANWR